ncbi:glutathione S-transferase C-terminal domain-containing protein homolog [Epargyreus clarus]|uniref:glutathione S-transferase C-terminal domain-containing protein homolog n=1 Tax=Epargyreus clarus TaxID=520877 RepID=UPI003C2F5F7C
MVSKKQTPKPATCVNVEKCGYVQINTILFLIYKNRSEELNVIRYEINTNMPNVIYVEACSTYEEYQSSPEIKVSIESLLIYWVYKYCAPQEITLKFVFLSKDTPVSLNLFTNGELNFIDERKLPWQASSCVFPVVIHEDTVITGLCAVARHICKYRSVPQSAQEHEDGLLGFRKSCLQAPNEVSIWTKFCEVDVIKTVHDILKAQNVTEMPENLVRFENHLHKPVRIHNVYKVARDFKKDALNLNKTEETKENKESSDNTRIPKSRKWKSKTKKELEIDCSTKIEDLDLSHQFAEGPFLTLADLVLFPSYHILIESLGSSIFQSLLPLTHKWFNSIANIPELKSISNILKNLNTKYLITENLIVPTTDDVSLYKSDPKKHNPKKRLFTKEDDIENALSILRDDMELNVCLNNRVNELDWTMIPDGANPAAGHLPNERILRKSQQLENLTLTVMSVAKEGDLIVDFCSGSGHLGILIAHLLPKCTVILLENKEQSLLRARDRVHEMGLSNVYFFQCNLDFFIGKFDIGVALHACGIASDLVLDKCLKANARFVLCPCCYGSLHATDRLVYPRSKMFSELTIDQYLCICHTADQTHKEHPLTRRGDKCMIVVDSDRARLAEEFGYKVKILKLNPLSCTPKNNFLIGVPS